MKKFISIILAFLLLSSALPFSIAFAEPVKTQISDDWESYNVYFSYDEASKTLTLSGEGDYGTSYESCDGGVKFYGFSWFSPYAKEAEKVVVEEGITSIGGASFNRFEKLKSVELPSTLKKIESYAFYECYNLRKINMPDSLGEIGYEAFRSCRKLTALNIPKGVISVGNSFIFDTPALKTLTVDKDNQSYTAYKNVLYSKDKTELIVSAAKNEKVTIPKTVTKIHNLAFALSSIKKITIPKTVTDLGGGLFYKSKVQEVNFEKGSTLKTIKGDYSYYGDDSSESYGMFEDCTNLKKLVLPNTVKKLEQYAIAGCKSLEYLYLGKSFKDLPSNELYGCKKLKRIKVHKDNKNFYTLDGALYSKRKYGKKVFRSLIFVPVNKKSISIPKNIHDIESFAFANGIIKKIVIPKNIEKIEIGVFYNCPKLESIKFEKGSKLQYIDGYFSDDFEDYCCYRKPYVQSFAMFYNCKKLKSVEFPQGLKETYAPLFENCPALKSVYFGKNLKGGEFYGNYFGYLFNNCKALEKVNISAKNKTLKSAGGVVFNKSKTTLMYYPQGKKGKTYNVPKSVKYIPYKAFWKPKYLKTIKILNTSSKLKYDMFADTSSFSKNITILVKKNSSAHKELKRYKKHNAKIKYKLY